MLSLFHAETDTASATVLAPSEYGAATADHRDDAPRDIGEHSALRRTLATLTAALAATRRGVGD
jgi:hypothetical protein